MVAVTACGGGDGGNNNPAAPTPVTPTPPAPPAAAPALTGFVIGVADSSFGQNTAGRITLSAAAPAGGFPVSITSSSNQAASVVSSVVVAAGTNTLDVPILTHKVSTPTTLTVSASAGDVTIPATLALTPGTFVSFGGSAPGVVLGQSRRIFGPDMVFSSFVGVALDRITVSVRPRSGLGTVELTFQAAAGQELRVGSYAGPSSSSGQQPAFSFFGWSPSCSGLAAFVITDLVYGPGPDLERFEASFAKECSVGSVFGDVLITQ